MADKKPVKKTGATENISPKGSPPSITGTSLLMVVVFAIICMIGILMIGGFLNFEPSDASQNSGSVEGNVGP